MTTPTDLIARLESASRADIDIDGEIYRDVLGYEASWVSPYQHERIWGFWKPDERGTVRCYRVPKLTESIDAALSLVPKGFGTVSMSLGEGERGSSVRLGHPYVYGNAKTLPIAIVIAALRAITRGNVT